MQQPRYEDEETFALAIVPMRICCDAEMVNRGQFGLSELSTVASSTRLAEIRERGLSPFPVLCHRPLVLLCLVGVQFLMRQHFLNFVLLHPTHVRYREVIDSSQNANLFCRVFGKLWHLL